MYLPTYLPINLHTKLLTTYLHIYLCTYILIWHEQETQIDYFIANIDVIQEVAGLRGILNDKLPTQTNGLVGLDIIPLVKHYSRAVTLEVKQDEVCCLCV